MTFLTDKCSRLVTSLVLGTALTGASMMSHAQNTNPNEPVSMVTEWDKTFPQSNKVDHRKVTFKNRYGITLVGDLYLPKDRANHKLAAIAVSGPFGAVKEQSSGLYAQTMAERGFITLAFDPSFTGESGGQPRDVASPDINTEDFSAAVDFLTTQADIDPERIGILGICGFGGFALNAAAMDTRVKATATSTMYDISRVSSNGYNDSVSVEQRYKMREQLNAQRTLDAKNGTVAPGPAHLPEKLNGDEPQFMADYFNFYKQPRGFHPRSVNSNGRWAGTEPLMFTNMPLLSYAAEIKNPVLIVHGEKAHSRYMSEDAFKKLTGNNKELLIVPGASHVDLYDNQAGKIPFDKFESFFVANLK